VGQESVVDGRYLDGFRPDGLPDKCGKRWSEADDSILRQHWPNLHLVAELTDRTVHGAETRGYALGLTKPAKDRYSSTVETIIAMWRDGHTGTQIAKQVGAKSRGAIMGKLNRLGLLGSRPKQQKKPAAHHRARNKEATRRYRARLNSKFTRNSPAILPRVNKTARVSVPPSPDAPPSLPNLPVVGLKPHHCRWPIGDPREAGFGFCGQQKHDHRYCAGHVARSRA
jgi:GcrA cell cycle regulator